MALPPGFRISFLVVLKGADVGVVSAAGPPAGPRYTRDSLRSLLQLVGCTLKHSHKVMNSVFRCIEDQVASTRPRTSRRILQVHRLPEGRACVSIPRTEFLELLSSCLAQQGYKVSPSSDEMKAACSWVASRTRQLPRGALGFAPSAGASHSTLGAPRADRRPGRRRRPVPSSPARARRPAHRRLKERRRCVIVLLCGTSGSGKSTLASVLVGAPAAPALQPSVLCPPAAGDAPGQPARLPAAAPSPAPLRPAAPTGEQAGHHQRGVH
jgi:hypothetical protein